MTWAEWWDSVLQAMQQPVWMSGLIQGVVGSVAGTLIALAGAGWVLIIQLRHDRELAAGQAREVRDAWTADRQADVANQVGLLLLDAAAEILDLDEHEWVRRIHATTPVDDSIYAIMNKQQIPGLHRILQAIDRADLSLPVDSAIRDLEKEIAANWYVSIQLAMHPSLHALTDEQTTTVLHRVSRNLLWPSMRALKTLGRALCRWDGRERPPGLADLPEWKPTSAGHVPPEGPVLDQLLEAAGASASDLTEVLGYRSSPESSGG